jgi:hypothetical protein
MADEKSRKRPSGHAVENGVIRYLSVSQIQEFDESTTGGCPRKWFFNKVKRLPSKQTGAQALGEAVHSQNEHYLLTGQDVLGPIARAGKHLLPEPGPDLLVEHPLAEIEKDGTIKPGGLEAAGVPLIGYIDLVNPREKPLEVVDFKTTSKKAYIKTIDEMQKTVQMTGYARWAIIKYPDLEAVRLTHIYYLTRGSPYAERVSTVVDLTTVKHRWQNVEHIVHRMKATAGVEDFHDVEPNFESCTVYGGCPYRTQCHESPLVRISMSLLSRMRQQNGVATPPPAPVPIDDLPKKELLIEDKTQAAAPVVPPDAPKPDPVLASAGTVGQIHRNANGTYQWDGKGWLLVDEKDLAPAEAPKAKRGPGRPKKTATPETATATPAPAPAVVTSTPAPAAPITTPTAAPGIAIYVDCIPTSGAPLRYLDGYLSEVLHALETECNTPDIRVSEHEMLKYGKWKGALAGLIKQSPPDPGVYVVERRGDFAEILVEALAQYVVCKGVK